MKIENTEIWITCESVLQLKDARAVDFRDNASEIVLNWKFDRKISKKRPEFHGDREDQGCFRR